MRPLLPLAIAGLLLTGSGARADEFLDQLDLVRQLYEEGDVSGAMTELDFARQLLQDKLGERFVAAFPDPPEGWEAEPAQLQPTGMLGGGLLVSRRYRRGDGPGEIDAQIVANSPMIQAFAAMMSNAAMMAAEPGAKRIRVGRATAVLTWDEQERTGEVRLAVGQAMISLEGRDLDDSEPLIALIKAFDLETVKELAGG